MSKYRQAARVDGNQAQIVDMLRSMGASVEVGHDDLLVGYQRKTFWFELKNPKRTLKKNGEWKAGVLEDSQVKLRDEWRGHYKVVHSFEQIVDEITKDAR